MSLYGAKREIERGDEAWERHGERNRERGRIRPSEPQAHRKKNLWPINTGKIFRFGYEILLLIAFSCWVGLDLICFCFGFLKHRMIERDTEIVFVNVAAIIRLSELSPIHSFPPFRSRYDFIYFL